MGRPSDFTPETANTICERLIEGESLRKICRDEAMPSVSTVCRWLGQQPAFRDQYAHARDAQADTLADETLDIADEAKDAALARLQVDARKWYASKLAPKRYGDKVQQELSGPDGGAIPSEMTIRFVRPGG